MLHVAQRHWLGTVPQVTDTLQEVLTNTCSLKTTIQAFQEELQLLKDGFQKVCEWSWAHGKQLSAEGSDSMGTSMYGKGEWGYRDEWS